MAQLWYICVHMTINEYKEIKQFFVKIKKEAGGKAFLTRHRTKTGSVAIICEEDKAIAVCCKDGEVKELGFAYFEISRECNGKVLHLNLLESGQKNRGIGRAIVNVVVDHAIKQRCNRIELLSLKDAKMFYKKLHFVEIGADECDKNMMCLEKEFEMKMFDKNLDSISKLSAGLTN